MEGGSFWGTPGLGGPRVGGLLYWGERGWSRGWSWAWGWSLGLVLGMSLGLGVSELEVVVGLGVVLRLWVSQDLGCP